MNIVAGNEKQTVLNSFLSEFNFGKIQYTLNLNDAGILAESEKKEFSQELNFKFFEWRFSGTEVEPKSGNVLFTGGGFNGRTFLAILRSNSKSEKARAVFSYSVCVAQAVKQGAELPANGAGGVLYEETKNKIRMLFLPPNIFEFSARNAGDSEYQKLQGVWQDQNFLSKNKNDANNARALFFTRAVFIYDALSGELPFPKENLEERQADILDANYLPLENKINGVSEILSNALSFDLERASAKADSLQIKNQVSDDERNFCFEELRRELALEKNGEVTDAQRKPKLSDDEFKAQAKKILSMKKTRADASRAFRRNATQFTVGVVLLIALLITGHYIRKDNLTKPTTVSLSARETVEVFFTGMHTIDTNFMQYSSRGKSTQRLIDSVGNIHVAGKMRSAYSQESEILSPEMWLYKPEFQDSWQFGLTNFLIGEDEDSLEAADNRKIAPRRIEKPRPLAEKNGAKKTFAVSFFRVHSEGPTSDISVEKFWGTAETTFVKDRWLLSDVNLKMNEDKIPIQEFEAAQNHAFEIGGNPIAAAEILRKKYEWIPTQSAMHNAQIEYETQSAKRARGELY